MATRKKIIVIGSGLGGLAIACRLAARGHDVKLFEKRGQPGGITGRFEVNGFKFDSGPTAITTPFMFEDLFEAAGKNLSDYVQLTPVEPVYRVFASTRKVFDFSSNSDATLRQIEKLEPGDVPGYQRYLNDAQQVYKKGFLDLILQHTLRFSDILNLAPDLLKFPPYHSIYRHSAAYVKNEFLRQVLSLPTLMSGGSPFNTPAIYALQNYLQVKWGLHYVQGGFYTLIEALTNLFKECGGSLWLNSPVSEILTEGRRVNGVRLADGSLHRGDCIVSDAELAYTYHDLIDEKYRRKYKNQAIEKRRFSQSFFVIYFGTRQRYRNTGLAQHNVFLPRQFQVFMQKVFDQHVLPQELMFHLHIPTFSDESIAPPGCESFCLVAGVPNRQSGINWDKMARSYRDRIFQFLEETCLPDLRSQLVAEHYIDPFYFENELNHYQGAAFSLQPTLSQTAWMRPHNCSEEFNNLYFVGAGTHPGAGIPAVLSSASIVDRLIELRRAF